MMQQTGDATTFSPSSADCGGYHGGSLAGHFSVPHLYKTLAQRWWWKNMYIRIINDVLLLKGLGEGRNHHYIQFLLSAHSEALVSDRSTNLLSHLMKDICALLGIKN